MTFLHTAGIILGISSVRLMKMLKKRSENSEVNNLYQPERFSENAALTDTFCLPPRLRLPTRWKDFGGASLSELVEAELRYVRQVHAMDDPSEDSFPRLSTTNAGHGCTLSTSHRFPWNELPLLESHLPTWTMTSGRDEGTETVRSTNTDVVKSTNC